MFKLNDLSMMLRDGEFHHATYRGLDGPSLWEGLWIYRKDEKGFRGYSPAFCFFKDDQLLPAAQEMVRNTGWSLGSYGRG